MRTVVIVLLPPDKPPPLREAVRMIASLGGFLGRKGDGEPRTTTMWRGEETLTMAEPRVKTSAAPKTTRLKAGDINYHPVLFEKLRTLRKKTG